MAESGIKGLRLSDEIDHRLLQRDVRKPFERIIATLSGRSLVLAVLVFSGSSGFVAPDWCLYLALVSTAIFSLYYLRNRRACLPVRLPKLADQTDFGAPKPGRRGFLPASGVVFLGNEAETNQQMWLGVNDLLTHLLVLGTTGSGKTQALVSLAFNALATGSGVFFIDPKASSELPMQIWQLSRFLGRDDDFRVLNYTTGTDCSPTRLTNTNNPFYLGTADALTQLLGSLMPPTEGSNSIFADKALALISSLLYALVDLREKGLSPLSVSVIRDNLSAENCVALLSNPDLSEMAKASLKAALLNCNWVESMELSKQTAFFEQYGYAQSYFGRALSSLTDTYGHIYGVECGEVDFRDVVLNRRILVTLLPSMEKSPAELASLGKITLSAIKTAASVGLGVNVEGHERDVLGSLPIHFQGTGPFLSIVDEYAAIVTPGFEMLLTQGRGLGLATVVASQDYAGLLEADRKGTQQIVANTTMKIFMKTDDPERTFGLIRALTGEAPVMSTTGFALKEDSMLSDDWRDNQGATAQLRKRSEFMDLASHIQGEAHCVFRGRLIRARVFHANPKLEGAVARVHRLLQMQ